MSSTVRIFCLSEVLGPLTHMDRTEGNEALIRREAVLTSHGWRHVPAVSGNALRHVCVRAPGMEWLVGEYGLAGKLDLPTLNFLFHGGALTESTGREDTLRVAEKDECLPLVKALGGALPNQILHGTLRCGIGTLVCEENRAAMQSILPAGWELPGEALRPAESYVGEYQYVTYDGLDRESHLLAPEPEGRMPTDRRKNADVRMLYVGQCVKRGAVFAHNLTLLRATPQDVGAVLLSLSLWQRAGGVVGGMGRVGHGKLATSVFVEGIDGTPEDLIATYQTRARAMKDRATAWLSAAFTPPEKAPRGVKRAGRKAKAATEEAPADA